MFFCWVSSGSFCGLGVIAGVAYPNLVRYYRTWALCFPNLRFQSIRRDVSSRMRRNAVSSRRESRAVLQTTCFLIGRFALF